jgi:hypothetical protein
MVNSDAQLPGQAEQSGMPGGEMAGPRITSYNLSESERPEGMKVRYKIRIVSGPRAKAVDEAQAGVIREVLEWSRQQRQRQQR